MDRVYAMNLAMIRKAAQMTQVEVARKPALGTPIDDQVLTRRPHRRAAAPVMIPPPQRLLLRDQAAEVPVRPGIPRGPGGGQQPLGRDPAERLLHAFGYQGGHAVMVTAP